jgi:hypothetical protein
MSRREQINAMGFVLGHGILNNPRSSRINGTWEYVGVTNEDGKWESIKPTTDEVEDVIWLEELGPGKLVFIPDKDDYVAIEKRAALEAKALQEKLAEIEQRWDKRNPSIPNEYFKNWEITNAKIDHLIRLVEALGTTE